MKKFVLAMLVAAPLPAQAALVEVNITGNLYQVSSSVGSRFSLGDAVTAQFVLDTDATGSMFYADTRLYSNAIVSGFISVSGYTATFSNAARAFVTDNEYAGAMDRFLIDDYGASADAVNGLAFKDLFLNWQDNSATATQNYSLPGTLAAISAYGSPLGGIDWATSDGNNRITFNTTGLDVRAVPEPATWMMMIAGFALAGTALRRRQPALASA